MTANRYKYLLNVGIVDSVTNENLPYVLNTKGEKIIEINFGYGLVQIKLAVIIAITTKNIHVPFHLWNKLDVLYVDGNCYNTHPSNLVWKFPNNGLTVNDFNEFRFIPGFTRYQINKEGEVYSNVVRRLISPYVDSNGYWMYGITPDLGKRTILGRHRLLALAFLEYPPEVDRLDVNHKNGIKSDNLLDNLEWSSRQLNCEHAYSTGLRTDNIKVQVRNVFNGVVKEFYSIEDCARQLKIDGETIRQRLKTNGQKTYVPGFQFKKLSDSTNWLISETPLLDILNSKQQLPIVVKNLLTNKVCQYESMFDFSKTIGMSSGMISYYLRNKTTTKIDNYEIKFANFKELSLSYFTEM
jgi:hypothetical protein